MMLLETVFYVTLIGIFYGGLIELARFFDGAKPKKPRRETGEEFYSKLYGKDWPAMRPYFRKEELV